MEATLTREQKAEVKATFTVDSPIPYKLTDLIDRLRRDDTAKGVGADGRREVKGEWEGRLTRLISRLEAKAEDRRYGFMFKPPASAIQYEWLAKQVAKLLSPSAGKPGIRIVDFSEVPSDILPVVTGVLRGFSTTCSSGWNPNGEHRSFLYATKHTCIFP